MRNIVATSFFVFYGCVDCNIIIGDGNVCRGTVHFYRNCYLTINGTSTKLKILVYEVVELLVGAPYNDTAVVQV